MSAQEIDAAVTEWLNLKSRHKDIRRQMADIRDRVIEGLRDQNTLDTREYTVTLLQKNRRTLSRELREQYQQIVYKSSLKVIQLDNGKVVLSGHMKEDEPDE